MVALKEMHMQRKVEFKTEDGTTLRGFVYGDDDGRKAPVIVMAHGFSGVLSALTQYAEHFAKAGFMVLLYDHRCFGISDGTPRQHADPYQQLADFRDAITYAQSIPGADPDRIGVWGSSYAGGHVIALGACDRRIKCVVAQIPYVSGHLNAPRLYMPDVLKKWKDRFVQERRSLASGAAPTLVPAFSSDRNADDCVFPPVSQRFIEASEAADGWRNEVTLRSLEFFMEYEPGAFARFVSPTPLLMVIGARDVVNPPDLSLQVYEEALEPKKLLLHPGGHFGTYSLQFEQTSSAALDWFQQHLG